MLISVFSLKCFLTKSGVNSSAVHDDDDDDDDAVVWWGWKTSSSESDGHAQSCKRDAHPSNIYISIISHTRRAMCEALWSGPRIKNVFQLVLTVLSSVRCAPHGLARAAVLCCVVILVLAEGALEGSLLLWWCEPSWRMRNKWLGLTLHWFPWLPPDTSLHPLCCPWVQCWFKGKPLSAQSWSFSPTSLGTSKAKATAWAKGLFVWLILYMVSSALYNVFKLCIVHCSL